MDPLSVTASIINVLQLVKGIIKYANDVGNAPKEQAQLVEEITSTAGTLYMLKDALEESPHNLEDPAHLHPLSGENGALQAFKTDLEGIFAIISHASRSKVKKSAMLWPFKKSQVEDMVKRVERHKSRFTLVLSMQNRSTSLRSDAALQRLEVQLGLIRDVMKAVHETQLGLDDRLVLDWLCEELSWSKQQDLSQRRVRGTCQWLLASSQFQSWLNGSHRVLWCPGIPGAGKTVAMSCLIEHVFNDVSDNCKGVAFTYCHYNSYLSDTDSILRGLLRHLAIEHPAAFRAVRDLHRQHQKQGRHPTTQELQATLVASIQAFERVFVVLDAYDECNDETKLSLSEYLNALPANVSLLVSSRPIESISSAINSTLVLPIAASDQDVEAFVEMRIDQCPRLRKWTANNQSLRSQIMEKVSAETNGMFLLAQLRMDLLSKKRSEREVLQSLFQIPATLNPTYDEAMLRIRDQSSEDYQLAIRIFKWLLAALCPVSMKQLRTAMAIQIEDHNFEPSGLMESDILISICGGLIKLEIETDRVDFVHYTFRSYLLDQDLDLLRASHEDIASTCITYLNFANAPLPVSTEIAIRGTPKSVPEVVYADFSSFALELFAYIPNNWSQHLNHCERYETYMEAILAFLSDPARLASVIRGTCVQLRSHVNRFQLRPRQYRRFNLLHMLAYWNFPVAFTRRIMESFPHLSANEDSNSEWTPLVFAIACEHFNVAELFMRDPRTNLNAGTGLEMGTAMHIAAAFSILNKPKCHQICRYLLAHGADVDARNKDEQTPLHLATEAGCAEMVDLLLTHGSDVHATSGSGATPLYYSARSNDVDIVETLLDAGADPNVRSWDDWTALHEAVCKDNYMIVRALIEAGADVHIVNNDGDTPLGIARKYDYDEVADSILELAGSTRWESKLPIRAVGGDEWENRDSAMEEAPG